MPDCGQGWWDTRAENKEAGHLAGNPAFISEDSKPWNREIRFLLLQLLIGLAHLSTAEMTGHKHEDGQL